jgi:hypothetical protein
MSSQMELRMTRQIGSLVSPVFYRIGLGYRSDSFHRKTTIFTQDKNELSISDFNTFAEGNLKNHI